VKLNYAVFNTDQINKKNIKFSASGLMRADETHYREIVKNGAYPGMPVHLQHDMHRLIGWSRQLGHYIDGQMVRVLGCIEEPENDEDIAALQARVAKHRARTEEAETAPFREELCLRLASIDPIDLTFLRMEAVFAKRLGLASELYPDFFQTESSIVDKDGLVDYRELLSRTTEITPGVFHDRKLDLLLVAHRFFRRSLSHSNALNTNFLGTFCDVAQRYPNVRTRLKLDPDLIGHPASATGLIELEYWHGPQYDDNIANIPNGVSVHKADKRTRMYEGVDCTQVWWKAPETRKADGKSHEYRTFEIEELIENQSPGLQGTRFGCRYAHAEFSVADNAITHFDGAIRSYEGEKYLKRIDALIDRAGKHADYTKVFRFDNPLPIAEWKRLLSDYYRGNNLIPEYLGAPAELDPHEGSPADATSALNETPLAGFIALVPGEIADGTTLYPELFQQIGNEHFPVVEVGMDEVAKHIGAKRASGVLPIGFGDHVLNLSRLGFANSDKTALRFGTEIAALADAFDKDVENGAITRAAIPLMWENDGLVLTLTIAGDAAPVAALLRRLPSLIDLTQMPSEWIENLASAIKEIAPVCSAPIIWKGVSRGVLEIGRQGVIDVRWPVDGPWKNAMIASGLLSDPGEPDKHLASTDL
jgi:hypothetical protein